MQKSTKDLNGNTIVATDGDIGKVDDSISTTNPGPSDICWPTRVIGFSAERYLSRLSLSARRIYQGSGSMSP